MVAHNAQPKTAYQYLMEFQVRNRTELFNQVDALIRVVYDDNVTTDELYRIMGRILAIKDRICRSENAIQQITQPKTSGSSGASVSPPAEPGEPDIKFCEFSPLRETPGNDNRPVFPLTNPPVPSSRVDGPGYNPPAGECVAGRADMNPDQGLPLCLFGPGGCFLRSYTPRPAGILMINKHNQPVSFDSGES